MDEIELSSVARSAEWILAEYNNQSNPSTFYSIGSEQSSSQGQSYPETDSDSASFSDSIAATYIPHNGVSSSATDAATMLDSLTAQGTTSQQITRTGSGSGTTSFTLSATNTGNLEVVYAYRSGSTTAPTLPSGWTSVATGSVGSGSSGSAYRVGCKVASSSSDTSSGTWTSATDVVGASYAGTAVGTTGELQHDRHREQDLEQQYQWHHGHLRRDHSSTLSGLGGRIVGR